LAVGVFGWATAATPWQLLVASVLSGTGWGAMSAAAVNAIVSPWFVRSRPAALGMAYNGGSIGGVIFSPLWVAAIGALGFSNAAAAIGLVMALTMWVLADSPLSRTPQQMPYWRPPAWPGYAATGLNPDTSAFPRVLTAAELAKARRFACTPPSTIRSTINAVSSPGPIPLPVAPA
jgi:hypothetical protein